MKLILSIIFLCINNFSSPCLQNPGEADAKEAAKADFNLAPSILIVDTY